jgi:ribonuclease R
VHVSTMADDYYRFEERAHVLRGENMGRVYRLGDKVSVQVIKVDMERRQVDLGLTEILDRVRASERNRGSRVSRRPVDSRSERGTGQRGKANTKSDRRRAQRPGRQERAAKRRKT